jgi:hypothetical protein
MTPLRKVEIALHGWNAVAENDDRGGEKLVEVHGYAALGSERWSRRPIPRQQLVQPMSRMGCDAQQ